MLDQNVEKKDLTLVKSLIFTSETGSDSPLCKF